MHTSSSNVCLITCSDAGYLITVMASSVGVEYHQYSMLSPVLNPNKPRCICPLYTITWAVVMKMSSPNLRCDHQNCDHASGFIVFIKSQEPQMKVHSCRVLIRERKRAKVIICCSHFVLHNILRKVLKVSIINLINQISYSVQPASELANQLEYILK